MNAAATVARAVSAVPRYEVRGLGINRDFEKRLILFIWQPLSERLPCSDYAPGFDLLEEGFHLLGTKAELRPRKHLLVLTHDTRIVAELECPGGQDGESSPETSVFVSSTILIASFRVSPLESRSRSPRQ